MGFEKDEDGNVTTVHCTYDPETRSGSGFEGRKVKGTIHWVSAESAIDAEIEDMHSDIYGLSRLHMLTITFY